MLQENCIYLPNFSDTEALWHWVKSLSTPWMTAANTFCRHPAPFKNAIFQYRFYCILGASRSVPTSWRNKWRDTKSVKIYRQKKQVAKYFFH